MIHKIPKTFAAFLKKRYNVKVLNKNRLPKKGAAIYAFNHPSRSDGLMAWLFLPGRPVRFLAKNSTFSMMWPVMHLAKQIPVYSGQKRGHETIAAALKALRKGKIIGIYPEGSSGNAANTPELREFKTGIGRLALLTGAPVYPIAIIGSYAPFKKVWSLPDTKENLTYVIGKPMYFKPHENGDSDMTLNKHVAMQIHDAIKDLLIEAKAPKEYLPKSKTFI